jgi:NTP pyrophosphatase (non-canonical NTP hydrolase)
MPKHFHDVLAEWKYCNADCAESPAHRHSVVCSQIRQWHDANLINVINSYPPTDFQHPVWLARSAAVHEFVVRQTHGPKYGVFSYEDAMHLALGLAGEAGEVAQLMHKFSRDAIPSGEFFRKLTDELADVNIYNQLLGLFAGAQLEVGTRRKLEEVVERWRAKGLKLGPPDYVV